MCHTPNALELVALQITDSKQLQIKFIIIGEHSLAVWCNAYIDKNDFTAFLKELILFADFTVNVNFFQILLLE